MHSLLKWPRDAKYKLVDCKRPADRGLENNALKPKGVLHTYSQF